MHDDPSLHTIGEFSRLTGLSEKALRLYDERGLLPPAEVDSDNRYRRYSSDQVGVGQFVAMLRAIDMPLAEVKAVVEAPASQRAEIVARYWYRIERDLDSRRRTVQALRVATEEAALGSSHLHRAIERARDSGVLGAIEAVASVEDDYEAGNAYAETMKNAYWVDKDLQTAIALGYAGLGRLLAAAVAASGSEQTRLRSLVKSIVYDIASFTWIGWDEPGIDIGSSDAAVGHAAAQWNLALAIELDNCDLPTSRAFWMLGAHLLTRGDLTGSRDSFESSVEHASRAGAAAEADLASAFMALTELIGGNEGVEKRLAESLSRLASAEDGADFINQVTNARQVVEKLVASGDLDPGPQLSERPPPTTTTWPVM